MTRVSTSVTSGSTSPPFREDLRRDAPVAPAPPEYCLGFTGVAGYELVVWDYGGMDRALLFDLAGNFTGESDLGVDFPNHNYNGKFAGGLFWTFDQNTDAWYGFEIFPVVCATACGDCNGDGATNILDALYGAQAAASLVTLSATGFSNCNVTGLLEPDPGAQVDILDALLLAQVAAGLPVVAMCCLAAYQPKWS